MRAITTFDMQRMISDFDGDTARFGEMAGSLVGEIPRHVVTMRESLAAGRLAGLEFSARAIGMLFDSLLARPAAEAARNLENASRRRARAEAEFAFESLEDEIEDFLEELSSTLTNTP